MGDFYQNGIITTLHNLSQRPLPDLDLRARYLDTAGVVVAPEWRPGGRSRVVFGVDVRPLFPARFLIDASGVLRYAESAPDHRHRPDPDDMMEVLRRLRPVR